MTAEPIPGDSAVIAAGTDNGQAIARVVLKPRKALPFIGRHPWVFESAIQYVDGDFSDGDVVDLYGEHDKFIARGVINTRSKLQVRLYTWNVDQPLDDQFWHNRLERAIQGRKDFSDPAASQARRLVFSESDGLSGLIVDQYADYLVAQLNAVAMVRRWNRLLPMLVELARPRGVIVRGDKTMTKEEGLESELAAVAWGEGPSGPVFIDEYGVRFGVDLLGGQKTGFYLDQSENRRATAKYMQNRRVLDLFCYSGGFSLAASRAGASKVLGIDGSERAITLARANAELNGLINVRFEQQDAFKAIDEMRTRGEKFGAVILDPPKFARGRRQVDEALRAYFRINRVAVDLLDPGGILVTCSCSGGVSGEDFLSMLSGVAQKSGRDIQVIEQRGASPDHPVSVTCRETNYLKCFICRVV